MLISRSASIPVVLMVVAVATAIAFIDYSIPHLEAYRQFARHTDVLPKAPIVAFVFQAHPYSFLMLGGAICFAVDILRRRACSARYLLWFACSFVTLCVCWTAITVFAMYALDPVFMFGPLSPAK